MKALSYFKILALFLLVVVISSFSKVKCSSSKSNVTYKNVIKHPTPASAIADPSNWRGVNLQLFIHNDKGKQLTQADFDYAADAGANIIRLAVFANPNGKFDAAPFFNKDNSFIPEESNPGIADLKAAINMAAKDNLKVIIDMHAMPGYTDGKIWTDQAYWDLLIKFWAVLAKDFKGNRTVEAFDLMNEPNIIKYIKDQNIVSKSSDEARMFSGRWNQPDDWKDSPRDYNLQINKLIGEIRDQDPDRCVIVEGFGMKGNPVNYNWMKPIEGYDNIVYSFHMYVPTELNMLGTPDSKNTGAEERAQPFTAQDENKIDKAFAPVLAFQQKYHVPIYVGEFGVTTEGVFGKDQNGNPYNAACWLKSVIEKMNANKWGWTYWDFWTPIRMPESKDDPRYKILNAAMKGEPIGDYCK